MQCHNQTAVTHCKGSLALGSCKEHPKRTPELHRGRTGGTLQSWLQKAQQQPEAWSTWQELVFFKAVGQSHLEDQAWRALLWE